MRMLFVLGQFFELRKDISASGWVYLAAYCTVVFVAVPNVLVGFLHYNQAEADGVKNLQPMMPLGSTASMCLDYSWFILNYFNSQFLPVPKYEIVTTYKKIDVSPEPQVAGVL